MVAKKTQGNGNGKAPAVKDDRFSKVHNDPRFARGSKKKNKLQLDDRFKGVLNDERFTGVQGKFDKYGRPIDKKEKGALSKFYRLEEEEDDDKSSSDKDEESNEKLSRLDYLNKMARGELSSDSDTSDDEEEEIIEEDAHEKEEVPLGEATYRFAVLNCDWSRIRALDLLALFRSFCPSTGAVQDVTIYPSDFGLEKMKEEEVHGPQQLWEGEEEEEKEEEKEEEEEYDSDDPLRVKEKVNAEDETTDPKAQERLRKYELQKLQYYYAVVTCDSVKTASSVFDSCDQLEYETSSNVLDLRFVPDDVEFKNEPKESAQRVPDNYKPSIFATTALQQTDVQWTWDEGDQARQELLTAPSDWKDVDDDDFATYVASDNSSDEEEGGDKSRKLEKLQSRYRSLLAGSDDEEQSDKEEGDMEMTFAPGAEDILEKKKMREKQAEETPFETYQREKKAKKNQKLHDKRKQQKAQAQEQQELLEKGKKKAKEARAEANDSDDEEDARDFDMKQIAAVEKAEKLKGKRKKKQLKKLEAKSSGGLQKDFAFDAEDPRFQALYANNSQFQLDPTDPKFKQTDATQAIFRERRKRQRPEDKETPTDESAGRKAQMHAVVDKLKRKSKH